MNIIRDSSGMPRNFQRGLSGGDFISYKQDSEFILLKKII